MADQQYCLRWNNHQPTLAGCFDRMLKDDQFTDCTLSAEGVNIVAHRMLLSACSPYFNELFKVYNKQQFPILILRDVSIVELKALMDYMYRGEVNISQDQLSDLLKVAEMLQIKGLYEAGFSESRASAPTPAAPRPAVGPAVARPQPLDLPPDITSDGAASPAPRRRKRVRRRSSSDDFPTTIDVAAEPVGQAVAPVTAQTEPVNNILSGPPLPVPPKLEEHQFDVVLPKEEYVDDHDSIENITLDDDEMEDMDQAGPSHGDGSSQGYPPSWHQSDRSTEDLFLSAQDSITNAGGAQRDSQVDTPSDEEIIEHPAEVYLKEEPHYIHDETPAAQTQCQSSLMSNSLLRTNTVPMVRLERIDIPLRSSPRLSALVKEKLRPKPTNQVEENNSPNFSKQSQLSNQSRRKTSEPSPKEHAMGKNAAADVPNVFKHQSISLPNSGLRRYQLILPKPSTSVTPVEKRRKVKETPKPQPATCDRIVANPPALKIMPPPTIMLAPTPPQAMMLSQTTQQTVAVASTPPQTMILPKTTQQTIVVAATAPQTMMLAQTPSTTMMMPHFMNTASVPSVAKPNYVKWPLPPKQKANSVSNITVLPDVATPQSAGGFQSSVEEGSSVKLSEQLVTQGAVQKSGLTPKGQGSDSKEVAQPVMNGYQCCFCNGLVGTMSELMTHLRICSGLAAAKKG